MGVGKFCRLKLSHVFGRERLNEKYVIRLYAGIGYCTKVLDVIHPHFKNRPKSRVEEFRLFWQLARGPRFEKRLILTREKAEREVMRDLASLGRWTVGSQDTFLIHMLPPVSFKKAGNRSWKTSGKE